jgi:Family of unknown function (DUF6221)
MIDDLAAFLSARYDEAEEQLRESADWYAPGCSLPGLHLDPEQAGRDIAAKRAILADCVKTIGPHRERRWSGNRSPYDAPSANQAFRTLLSLASAYDDHPDYLPKWKP